MVIWHLWLESGGCGNCWVNKDIYFGGILKIFIPFVHVLYNEKIYALVEIVRQNEDLLGCNITRLQMNKTINKIEIIRLEMSKYGIYLFQNYKNTV